MGNKTRFINHQSEACNTNLNYKALWCNGVVRYAFFAKRDIKLGEELFFNYRWTGTNSAKLVEKSLPKGCVAKGKKTTKRRSKSRGSSAAKHDDDIVIMPGPPKIMATPVADLLDPDFRPDDDSSD